MWNARYLFVVPVLMAGIGAPVPVNHRKQMPEQEQEQEQERVCSLMLTTANIVTI